MKFVLAAGLAAAILVSGCATKEGFVLPTGSGPTKESVDDFNRRNSAGAPTSQASGGQITDAIKTALVPEVTEPRMIVIGSVMALTLFDEPTLGNRYDTYQKQMESGGAAANFARDWYISSSAGETAVKFSGITGLYTRFFKAEVPKDLVRQISFASAFGTFMAGTSGDLVAAERSAKLGTWVTRLLCSEKQIDYSACEAQYQRGIYQSADGKEIDDKLQLVSGGKVIDPITFKLANLAAPVRTQKPTAISPPPPPPPPAPAPAPVAMPAAPAPAAVPAPAVIQASPQAPAATKDLAAQLEKLNELKTKGLITEAEYQQKRRELLNSL